MSRVLKQIGLIALTIIALGLGGANAASAASSYIGSNSGGANVRTCPNTGCAAVVYLANGTGVTMRCWVDSQWVYPPNSDYATPRWFYINSAWGNGYVHSSLVENQTSVPRC